MTIIFKATPTLQIELECEEQAWEEANDENRELFIKEDLMMYIEDIIEDIIRQGEIKLIK